jgi:hypothetical protein
MEYNGCRITIILAKNYMMHMTFKDIERRETRSSRNNDYRPRISFTFSSSAIVNKRSNCITHGDDAVHGCFAPS